MLPCTADSLLHVQLLRWRKQLATSHGCAGCPGQVYPGKQPLKPRLQPHTPQSCKRFPYTTKELPSKKSTLQATVLAPLPSVAPTTPAAFGIEPYDDTKGQDTCTCLQTITSNAKPHAIRHLMHLSTTSSSAQLIDMKFMWGASSRSNCLPHQTSCMAGGARCLDTCNHSASAATCIPPTSAVQLSRTAAHHHHQLH